MSVGATPNSRILKVPTSRGCRRTGARRGRGRWAGAGGDHEDCSVGRRGVVGLGFTRPHQKCHRKSACHRIRLATKSLRWQVRCEGYGICFRKDHALRAQVDDARATHRRHREPHPSPGPGEVSFLYEGYGQARSSAPSPGIITARRRRWVLRSLRRCLAGGCLPRHTAGRAPIFQHHAPILAVPVPPESKATALAPNTVPRGGRDYVVRAAGERSDRRGRDVRAARAAHHQRVRAAAPPRRSTSA